MNNEPQVENPNQVTMSKGRLRTQVRELELEIVWLKDAPLRREAERLRVQNDRLQARCVAIEEQALADGDAPGSPEAREALIERRLIEWIPGKSGLRLTAAGVKALRERHK